MLPLLHRYERRRPISWMVGAFAEIIRGSNGQVVNSKARGVPTGKRVPITLIY